MIGGNGTPIQPGRVRQPRTGRGVAVWLAGLTLNCVAVAIVGPWAIVATIGGALIAAGTLALRGWMR